MLYAQILDTVRYLEECGISPGCKLIIWSTQTNLPGIMWLAFLMEPEPSLVLNAFLLEPLKAHEGQSGIALSLLSYFGRMPYSNRRFI